jgi:hypothetical protein
MKKLITIVTTLSILGASSSIIGNRFYTVSAQNPLIPEQTVQTLAAETIDDIAIPTDILISVQTEHQGYAVTHASTVMRDGKQAYRLLVSRSDATTERDSFYLYYDTNWKSAGEEKIVPVTPTPMHIQSHIKVQVQSQPEAPAVTAPHPTVSDMPKPEQQPKPEPENTDKPIPRERITTTRPEKPHTGNN